MTAGQVSVRSESGLQLVIKSFALIEALVGCIGLVRTASASPSLGFGYDLDEKGLPTTP